MGSHLLVALLELVLSLIVLISYLLTLERALNKCAPASRTMKPGKVWLMLIPVFGFVWHFVIVINMTKSLGNEFRRLGTPRTEANLGQNIGLAHCVCTLCLVSLPLLGSLFACPVFLILLGRLFAAIVILVLWIAYWNRIADSSRILDRHQAVAPASPVS